MRFKVLGADPTDGQSLAGAFQDRPPATKVTVLTPHARNMGSTWGQLGPTRPQLGPEMDPLGSNFGPTWLQDGATWPQLGPVWEQLRPKLSSTWAQHWGHCRPNTKSSRPPFSLMLFGIDDASCWACVRPNLGQGQPNLTPARAVLVAKRLESIISPIYQG